MSIKAMKLALEALKRLKAYGNVFRFRQDEQNPYDQACEAITILRTAIEQAENYQHKNPLGGPAKVFDAMADAIRAGDDYHATLRSYGFLEREDKKTIDCSGAAGPSITPLNWHSYADKQRALDKKAENARELGLDYEPVPWIENMTIDSTNELSKPTAPVQEMVTTIEDLEQEIYENTRRFVSHDVMEWMLKRYYTTPQPRRKWFGLTPADFDWLEQVFANKVSNDFVFADIVCVISAKLKERNSQ